MARALAKPLWKVCCIASIEEAQAAIGAGADVLGLVAEMPSGPGVLSDDEIARIAEAVRGQVETWVLTSRTTPESIAAHVGEVGTSGVQVVSALEPGAHAELRALAPHGTRIVQVVHVEGPEAIAEAVALASNVDALLLDSGRPNAGVLGGTGEAHDWTVSRQLVREVHAVRSDLPVWLAGGLKPENLSKAFTGVVPDGLDLCSGLRTAGKLDRTKLAAFQRGLARLASPSRP